MQVYFICNNDLYCNSLTISFLLELFNPKIHKLQICHKIFSVPLELTKEGSLFHELVILNGCPDVGDDSTTMFAHQMLPRKTRAISYWDVKKDLWGSVIVKIRKDVPK